MLVSRTLTIAGIITVLDSDPSIPRDEKWNLLMKASAGQTIEASGYSFTWVSDNTYKSHALTVPAFVPKR